MYSFLKLLSFGLLLESMDRGSFAYTFLLSGIVDCHFFFFFGETVNDCGLASMILSSRR